VLGLMDVVYNQLWTLWFVCIFFLNVAIIGVTVGSHRLWSHKAFEAKLPLRIFLMLSQASAGVWSIKSWYKNHSAHHKWSDSDADPHNANRGLMFAHGYFAFMKQHPLNAIKNRTINVEKIMLDPVVKFQYENFEIIFLVTGMLLPTMAGVWLGNDLLHSFLVCYCLKHAIASQLASLLNSAAHAFGSQPYHVTSQSTDETILSYFTWGEGFHNYHHAFPMDYATGEFGGKRSLITLFIDLMARFGQAYNLKSTPKDVVERVKERIANLDSNNYDSD